MGFEKPQYTQVPNELLDIYMRDMGEAELRVVLVAVRKTLGYHKQYDAISLTQFEKYTGMSRRSVINGIEQAVKRGLLKEIDADGYRGVKSYELVFNDDDQSTTLTSEDSIPVSDTTSELSTLELVNVVHTQKKIDKRNTDKRALPEKNGNDTHLEVTEHTTQDTQPSKPKRVDAYYDAIATAWNISNSGIIVQLKGMLCDKGKVKGDWLTYKVEPPLSLDEVAAFGDYARRRMKKEFGKNEMPSKPATIALWVDAWRQIRVKTDAQVSSQAQHEIEPFAGIYDAIDVAGAAGTRAAVTADQVRATMVGEGMRSAAKALATVFQTKGA